MVPEIELPNTIVPRFNAPEICSEDEDEGTFAVTVFEGADSTLL